MFSHFVLGIFTFVFIQLNPVSSFSQEFTLLYTNDIESVYEPVKAFWNEEIEYIGGIPQLATLIEQIREQAHTSFLLDAGDIYTGSLSKATNGKLAFDIYSAMGYDAITLGNHEFEYGWEVLKEVKQRARFPVLNANIFYEGTDINICQQYSILEKNGIRIGVIGIMGEDAFINTMMKKNRKGLEVRPAAPIVQRLVDKLKPEVDMIVVLTHQNKTAPMQTDKEADLDVQRGFDEDYALAGAVKGIDMIIGGHSDHGLWKPVKHPETGTLIGLTFGQGKYLGYAKFKRNHLNDKVDLVEGKLIPVVADTLKPSMRIKKLISDARIMHKNLSEVIGTLDKQAFRRYYRESNIGNLLADILKDYSRADVAMISSGSIRFDLNPGPVTKEQLMNVFPFTDVLSVVDLSGKNLREVMEYSYSLSYGLVQFAGIKAVYNSQNKIGSRLIELSVNGEKVNPDRQYRLATISYAATGGDGFAMLANKPRKDSEIPIIQIFIDYFQKYQQIEVPALGRQVDIGKNRSNK